MSQPVRMVVVGLNFGRWILEEIVSGPARAWISLAGVCDLDDARRMESASKYGVKSYANIDEVLADESVEAVGVFTGPVGRARLIEKIIGSKRHVMTTKPFEIDPIAARTVLQRASELGVTLHLNSPAPEPPEYIRKMAEWRRLFHLGAPVSFYAEVTAHYREKADGSWYDDPAKCPVAPIFRLGIYLINDLTRVFGSVSAVQATTSSLFTRRPTPDNACLLLQFESRALGVIHASFAIDDGQSYSNTVIAHFERGTIHHNVGLNGGGAASPSRLSLVARSSDGRLIRQDVAFASRAGEYRWDLFHRSIRGAECIPTPIDDVVRGIQVIGSMARAEALNTGIEVP